MSRFLIIFAIAASYFVFAILLNSVGTVILLSINSFDISKANASLLEGFKDLPIAFVSFLVASFIPRIGYKIAILIALVTVTLMCIVTPIVAEFWVMKLLFATIGAAFALVKVSVYSVIGQLSPNVKSHTSLMNTIEGIFMLGVLSGYWFFSFYIDAGNPESLSWLNVYYLLAGITLLATAIVCFAPIRVTAPPIENTALTQDFMDMLRLTYQPLVLVFVISIFMYVLIEQGIGTWLPTFNSQILSLPTDISVQITSIFAAMIAIGRLSAGVILRYVDWFKFLLCCLFGIAAILIISLMLTNSTPVDGINSIWDAPIAAFLMPMVGLMMAPIYPVLNSIILSSLALARQSQMTGLIVVFSALGGTTGSLVTGNLFEIMGGKTAFSLILVPIGMLLISLTLFKRATDKNLAGREVEA